MGLLLVADPTVSWAGGAAAALALLPSAAGALWAGRRLWSWPARSRTRWPDARWRGAATRRRAAGALAGGRSPRARGVCAASCADRRRLGRLLVLIPAGPGRAGVLAGFGVVALATLLVGLLESLGRPSLAAVGVAAGLAAELLVRLLGAPFAGAALLAGGTLAVLVLVPGVLVLLARPARTLATTLWIT